MFCAVVPDYRTLVISRCIRGVSVGLNFSSVGILYANLISSYDLYNLGKFIGLLAFSIGGGWVAIMGYLLLDTLGWRVLVVCTSIPVFIPPILILHCVVTNEEYATVSSNDDEDSEATYGGVKVDNYVERVVKSCAAGFICSLQGLGSILLIPALLRYENQLNGNTVEVSEQSKLLILVLIYGAARVTGRISGFFFIKYIKFRILHPINSAIIALSYTLIVVEYDNLQIVVIGMFLSSMAYCITQIEVTLMEVDEHYFGSEGLVLGAGLTIAFGSIGASVGAVLAAFLDAKIALLCTMAASYVQIIVFCCITERT